MIFTPQKKAQVTLTFNWVYILIAGTLILLFFIGIVVRQKAISEEKLSYDVIKTLESILVGAGVSESTKNFIDTSGLVDFTLEFRCELDEGGGFRDIFSDYAIEDTSASVETPIQPIFSPKEIQTAQIITWSLPYEFPFKVVDMLMLTSINTKYYVIGNSDPTFITELENSTSGLNFEFVGGFDEMDAGSNFHVRIIDFDSSLIYDGSSIPNGLETLEDSQVSAVQFSGTTGGVIYFEKRGSKFKRMNAEEVIIISASPKERDAAKYGAIFAGSAESYKCNMMKVFERLEILAQIYQNKLDILDTYYALGERGYFVNKDCTPLISPNGVQDNSLALMIASAKTCTISGFADCSDLETYALQIEQLNLDLDNEGCVSVY